MIMPLADNNNPVRLAVREDEDELLAIAREVHPVSALRSPDGSPLPMDEDMVRGELRRAIEQDRSNLPSFIGVVGEYGDLHASIYLSCELTWYSPLPVLGDRWIYVRPQYRRSNLAAALLDFAKGAATAARLPLVVSHMTVGREAAKSRLFRRHFGNPVGAFFVHSDAEAGA